MVMSYYPNDAYLTENPEPRSQTPAWCCNAEKKARRRVTYASTNLKKNYFTTLQQYRENRCLTYDQRAFNFAEGDPNIGKPGGPESTNSTYYANCQPNTEMNIGDPSAFFDSLLAKRIISQEQYDLFKNVSLYDQLDEMSKLLTDVEREANQTFWQLYLDSFDTNHDGNVTYAEFLQYYIENENDIEDLQEVFKSIDINENDVIDFNDYLYYMIYDRGFFGFQPYQRTNITFDDIYTYLNTLSSDIRANAMNSLNNISDKRCTAVVYKPNNYQFAKQGAVDSSTRLLKLNVDTITKSAFTNNVNLPKNKVPHCTSILRFQNKQSCNR